MTVNEFTTDNCLGNSWQRCVLVFGKYGWRWSWNHGNLENSGIFMKIGRKSKIQFENYAQNYKVKEGLM